MSREEKRLSRYRAMFRDYPDALTPGEVQNAEDICFCCDECKHYDGDFSKRSQWRPDCPRHKFPEKYLEMQRIVEQRRARAAETRRRNFQIIKGGKP